jgi:hypothetical protein
MRPHSGQEVLDLLPQFLRMADAAAKGRGWRDDFCSKAITANPQSSRNAGLLIIGAIGGMANLILANG